MAPPTPVSLLIPIEGLNNTTGDVALATRHFTNGDLSVYWECGATLIVEVRLALRLDSSGGNPSGSASSPQRVPLSKAHPFAMNMPPPSNGLYGFFI